MAIIKFFTDTLQSFEEFFSKDEIVFGEIVRIFDKMGYPCIAFNASQGYQSGRFLLNQEVLFSLTVALDKKLGGTGILSIQAEVRNKLADPDDMVEMFKTDFSNIAKIPLLGQIKINHEYNTIYARTSTVARLNSYLKSKGVVDREKLEHDLLTIVDRLEEALKRFKKG